MSVHNTIVDRARSPWLVVAVGAALLGSMLMAAPAAAVGKPVTVTVTSVAQLEAAIAAGADTVLIEPGDYVIDGTLLLEDMDLIGAADGVTFSSLDPGLSAATTAAIFQVAGTVLIENVGFTGGGFSYVSSAFPWDAQSKNDIAIRNSRFETASFVFDEGVAFDPSLLVTAVTIGNAFADPTTANSWDVEFENNYVRGGFSGIVLANFYSDATGSTISGSVHDNFFEKTLDPATVAIATLSGEGGSIKGTSRDNTYFLTGGVAVGGGIGDFFFGLENPDVSGVGGSHGDVDWKSQNEHFTGPFGGIGAFGGRRYRVLDSPSEGNEVRLKIISPTFSPEIVDGGISILGSSINFPDEVEGDFPANGDGEGNHVVVTMTGADFGGSAAGVWIRNHGGNLDFFDFSSEPSYGNEARLTGSPTSLAASNPGVNDIPGWYFTGGGK